MSTSDKNFLDNIPLSEFGNASRVTVIRYCIDKETGYLNSVQTGITNGIGSQIKYLQTIGLDDSIKGDDLACEQFAVENEKFRVAEMEIGFIDGGSSKAQGVIYLGLTVRHVDMKSPSQRDVIIGLGKNETFMTRQKLFFSQEDNAFIGLVGSRSLTGSKSIVKLGAIEFTCWSLDIPMESNSLSDNLADLYYDNSNFLWIGLGLTLIVLTIIIVCSCYLHKSLMLIKQLQHRKALMVLDPEAMPSGEDTEKPGSKAGQGSPSKTRDADNTSGQLRRKGTGKAMDSRGNATTSTQAKNRKNQRRDSNNSLDHGMKEDFGDDDFGQDEDQMMDY